MTVGAAPTLRPYQEAALESIERSFEQGQNRLLIKKPTGTGKTVMFAALLRRLAPWLSQFPEGDRRMLVIAHREELLTQAAAKIRDANPGLMVSIEQGERRANSYADVVVASVQTLAAMKYRRLKRLIHRRGFRIVVVDEAHHAAAPTYRTELVHLGFLPPADASEESDLEAANHDDIDAMQAALAGWDQVAPKDRLLVGVTATPTRSDAIGLGCVFQSIAYSYALRDAIDDGWLVPPVPWVVETAESLDEVRVTRGEFNQRDLAEAVNKERRNRLAVKAWEQYAYGVPTIAFTVDVAHAHALAAQFAAAGVRAQAISGETPKDDRRAYLRAFQDRRIDVLTNCMVLTEGTDLPLTGCILHAKPTRSATLYEQMTGRGLRIHPGKSECIVIDLVDVAKRHSLQTAPVLYGLPPTLDAKGRSLHETAKQLEELRDKYPGVEELLASGRMSLDDLAVRAETFDIWSVPSLGAFGSGRAMQWIKAGDEVFKLSYPWADGTEIVTVQRDVLGHYDVSLTLRPNDGGPVRQRTLAREVPTADAAAGLAEAFVLQERRAVTKLTDRTAPWRSRPASEKQLGLLRRLRVPVRSQPPLTMGEASDLINLAKARR